MASAVFADRQRTRGPTLQQGRVRMVQTRTNPGDSPCQYPCVQQFLFCYLAKVETHEESAFILRKFTASSKCPNVRNTHVDVRSPYVDIWSADFYIAPAYLGACVRVLTRMPTAYYLSLVWYDVYYIRNLLSSYKNNHRLQKVLLSEVPYVNYLYQLIYEVPTFIKPACLLGRARVLTSMPVRLKISPQLLI